MVDVDWVVLFIFVDFIFDLVYYLFCLWGKYFCLLFVLFSVFVFWDVDEEICVVFLKVGVLIEFIYLVLFVYDDVIDEVEMRRGWLLVNVVYGNKVVVLVGDLFYD